LNFVGGIDPLDPSKHLLLVAPLTKDQEIKKNVAEKIELEAEHQATLHNKWLMEQKLRSEIAAKDTFINGLHMQVQALEATIRVLKQMTQSAADSTTAEISKQMCK